MNAPPLLVSFSSTMEYREALSHELRGLYWETIEKLISKKLPPVVSIRCLSILFGYSPRFLGAMYQFTERYYRTFTIKAGKKKRTINAPKVALKVIQKWLGYHLGESLSFCDHVYGFIKGKSAIQGAYVHCGASWIYSVDIENFFQTTNIEKVKSALNGIGFQERGSEVISKLCCYSGNLAQGSPASPILSNLVFTNTDNDLARLANKNGLLYSRYADDIVFSGKEDVPADLSNDVKSIITRSGWKISEKKEYLAKRPHRLKVYGLLVNGDYPRLTKGYRNRIRAFKHLVENEKIADENKKRLLGHLAYAKSIDNFSNKY
ncbi:MAG: reverse transcriptase family protein [Proteobacteria bacterium]|nr:reverse transcriptase family protein [Pseudomonadota bacterium]